MTSLFHYLAKKKKNTAATTNNDKPLILEQGEFQTSFKQLPPLFPKVPLPRQPRRGQQRPENLINSFHAVYMLLILLLQHRGNSLNLLHFLPPPATSCNNPILSPPRCINHGRRCKAGRPTGRAAAAVQVATVEQELDSSPRWSMFCSPSDFLVRLFSLFLCFFFLSS